MKQQKKKVAITILHSDAQADQPWHDQLILHLSQLQREGLIEQWSEPQILAGADRAQQINQAIRSAQIILLLMSADFLASDTCSLDEMRQALSRHKRGEAHVVPIVVRPCDWQRSPFVHLQCLPRNSKPIAVWDNQDEAFVAIAQELRRVIARHSFSSPPLGRLEQKNRARLLKRVRAIWIEGLLEQSLHRAIWIDLHLQEQPDALENPWRMIVQELNQAPRALPSGTSIVQVYDEADGKLLILGDPGSGKTTLLLQLARTLLDRAEADERHQMPIIFNLSSWAEQQKPLATWLVDELKARYQVPRNVAQNWVDTNQVLPLLDGLDEVAKEVRSACVKQINDYYQSNLVHRSNSMVVSCRREEYAALSTRVMLQQAVSILPLTDLQINTYMEQAGEQVNGLRQALNEDPELHSLACQPLMLNIFVLAYQGARAEAVPTGGTREEMQQIIFARYVDRMLKRREQTKRWKPELVIHSLSFLAKQMQRHNQTVFSVENLQPTWLSKQALYRWYVGLLFLLVGGFVFSGSWSKFAEIKPAEVITWSWKEGRSRVVSGLYLGLPFGVLGGLLVGLLQLSYPRPGDDPFDLLLGGLGVVGPVIWLIIGLLFIAPAIWLTGELGGKRTVSLFIWMIVDQVGLWGISILVGTLTDGLVVAFPLVAVVAGWLVVSWIMALVSQLIGGLVFWSLRKKLSERPSPSPRRSIPRSGKGGLVVWLVFGLMGWEVGSVVPGHVGWQVDDLVAGSVGGLVGWLASWLILALSPQRGIQRSSKGLVVWLVFGLVGWEVGVWQGFHVGPIGFGWHVGWLVDSFIARLVDGLVGWLASWLVLILIVWLFGALFGLSRGQILERRSLSPNEGIRRSGRNGLVFWLISMLVGGLIGALIGGLIGALIGALIGGLIGALIGALMVGLPVSKALGLDAFVKHFLLRFFLLLRGDLPWNLVPFLDQAAGRLLLRRVGGSYIFVHRLLLNYFADLAPTEAAERKREPVLSVDVPSSPSTTPTTLSVVADIPTSPLSLAPRSLPCGHEHRLNARYCSICGTPLPLCII